MEFINTRHKLMEGVEKSKEVIIRLAEFLHATKRVGD